MDALSSRALVQTGCREMMALASSSSGWSSGAASTAFTGHWIHVHCFLNRPRIMRHDSHSIARSESTESPITMGPFWNAPSHQLRPQILRLTHIHMHNYRVTEWSHANLKSDLREFTSCVHPCSNLAGVATTAGAMKLLRFAGAQRWVWHGFGLLVGEMESNCCSRAMSRYISL